MSLLKPPKLIRGDKVAAITLSWGGPSTFPRRFEIGKQRIESLLGLQVVPTKHALKDAGWIQQHPEARAEDLMEAFLDPSIKGIISTIGGNDSIRIVPFVDLQIIKDHPKVFMGYSDTTVTHFMCLKAGLGSFYGPSVMTAFAENVAMHDYTLLGVGKALFSSDAVGAIPHNTEGWTTDLLEWGDETNQNLQRLLHPPSGWYFIGDTTRSCRGRLIGGCLELLDSLIDTQLWPDSSLDHSVWDQSVLFLETANGTPSMVKVFMKKLAAQGILSRLEGILFSKPGGNLVGATEEVFHLYDLALLTAINESAVQPIPIVTCMDFGHSDPMWTLPYGVLTEIDPCKKTVTLLESGVR